MVDFKYIIFPISFSDLEPCQCAQTLFFSTVFIRKGFLFTKDRMEDLLSRCLSVFEVSANPDACSRIDFSNYAKEWNKQKFMMLQLLDIIYGMKEIVECMGCEWL